MKKYFIYAVSALALAGCSSDDFLGGQPSPTKLTDNNVINFNGGSSATTRATGGTAANKLGKKFFVYGTKVKSETEANDETDQQVVYMNYLVQFKDGTANTTVSNTAGWEYVGVTNDFTSAVTPNVGNKPQTIKYWDYSAPSYVFYACSADENDLSNDNDNAKVKIEKITNASSIYEKGYEVTLKKGAHPENLYFSDRKVLTKSTNAVHGKDDVYGGEVNFTFRNSMTKVRVAFYETIPGYSVKIDGFYSSITSNTANTSNFVADLKQNTPLVMSDEGTKYNVVYYKSGDLENQPRMIATEDGAEKNVLTLGKGLFVNSLGTEKTNPTYDTYDTNDTNTGVYTWFMPQTENTSKLKLKVDYTLTSTDGSNETINVKGATAEVPAELLCWKPNYAYTYLFKISTNTNGTTGDGNPAGLYPITFDASVVETAEGNAEYITTVSEASITTFAVDATGKYVNGANAKEYTAGSDIYATVVEGNALKTLTIGTNDANTKVYKIADTYASTANEAQVAEWVANGQTTYYSDYEGVVSVETTVPSGDGHNITLADPAKALKLERIAAGTYAIEYTNTSAWTGAYKPVYKVIQVVN